MICSSYFFPIGYAAVDEQRGVERAVNIDLADIAADAQPGVKVRRNALGADLQIVQVVANAEYLRTA